MRNLIVVDVETTGLDTSFHVPLEIAAINVATKQEIYFVPWLPSGALGSASPDALQINRYYERGVFRERQTLTGSYDLYAQLWDMLDGNTIGGSNPRFDAAMLMRGLSVTAEAIDYPSGWKAAASRQGEPWHHRLAEVASYAAGALALHPAKTVGLSDLCQRLNVTNSEPHSALGDARATAECFDKLMTGAVPS